MGILGDILKGIVEGVATGFLYNLDGDNLIWYCDGCNAVLNPGTVVGKHTNIYPLSFVRGFVPAESIHKNNGELIHKRDDVW